MTKKILLLSTLTSTVMGHGYLTQPLPRQYREEGIDGISWTKWMGITVPGDGSFNPGEGNAPNLNAGIGGGGDGANREQTEGHGLCGDIGSRKAFESGIYGATPARGTYSGTLDVKAKLTAYHAGWFEFRLCNPGPGGVVTQACLNEHVLEVDSSTPYYPQILDYDGMHGMSGNGNGGWYKCQNTGGHFDPLSSTPNTVWPSGSCCNGGGACSPPSANTDRYVVEFAGEGGVREYDIVLKLPNIECDNCVLQWMYQTANSREAYPESFWNCADIAVTPFGPTQPTPAPAPTNSPPTNSPASPTTAPPTSSEPSNPECGDCQGCWWTATSTAQGCYGWPKATCDSYGSAYVWCSGSGSNPTPAPASPTNSPPTTSPPASPTTAPPTAISPTISSTPSPATGSLADVITREQFEDMFSLRHTGPACHEGVKYLTYDNFINAADKYYPNFGHEGSAEQQKREVAAFLGQISQETSGWWAGQPYRWGLCFVQEVGCEDGQCTQYTDSSNTMYPAAPGKTYQGRGALQITWNANYGQLSEAIYGDKYVLLNDPDRLANDGELAFRASLWFWMTPQQPKPSSHDVMIGVAEECPVYDRYNGFGRTTNIINGGLECTKPTPQKVANRVNYFSEYASDFGISTGDNLYCDTMKNYNYGACPNSSGGGGGGSTPTSAPPTSAPPAGGGGGSTSCGSCQGCYWTQYSACYKDWDEATCNRYSGYEWCP